MIPREYVLDASALLAYLQGEAGGEAIWDALVKGSFMSAVNYAEVLTKLAETGADADVTDQTLRAQGISGALLHVLPMTEVEAVTAARLRGATKLFGLSLGDRCCLATGLRLGLPVLTADRAWSAIDIGIPVQVIRA